MKTPFTILVDTNEGAPWLFQDCQMLIKSRMQPVEVQTREIRLPIDEGDYQVEGIPEFSIERKSLNDAYLSLSPKCGRDAFREQIEHMNFSLRKTWVIVEASWPEFCSPEKYHNDWRSEFHPHAAAATVTSWMVRYPRVSFHFPGSRRRAELFAFRLLEKVWKHNHANGRSRRGDNQLPLLPDSG